MDEPPAPMPKIDAVAEDLDDVESEEMKPPTSRSSSRIKRGASLSGIPVEKYGPQFQAQLSNLLQTYQLPNFSKIVALYRKSTGNDIEYKNVEAFAQSLELFVDIGAEKVLFRNAVVTLPTTLGTVDGFLEKLNTRVQQLELVKDGNLVDERLVDLVCGAIRGTADETEILHARWRAVRVAISTNMPQENLALAKNCGEMFLQQTVFSPIAELLSCFDVSKYCADKMVHCAHVVGCNNDDKTTYQVACMPDAALRLTEKFYIGAMMEIKDFNADINSLKHDKHKSILMTCMSILALQEYLSQQGLLYKQKRDLDEENREERGQDSGGLHSVSAVGYEEKSKEGRAGSLTNEKKYEYGDIAIPFVLAKHDLAILYVTRVLEPHDGPVVSRLMQIKFTNGNPTDKGEKARFMAILAILVADIFKISREHFALNEHFSDICAENQTSQKVNSLSKPKRSSSKSHQASGSERGHQDATNPGKYKDAARQVASWNGQVKNLIHLFPRVGALCFDDDMGHNIPDQKFHWQKSPFYFKGLHHSKSVFCKVWHEGDSRTDRNNIDEEIQFHYMANKNDVPSSKVMRDLTAMDVAYPAKSKFSTIYHVLVTEYYDRDVVAEQDALKFAKSLVQSVLKLHKIGVLHCDIKPSNILWDSQEKVARLIDFGHAQYVENAWSYPATPGYEAPEISENHPHSKLSDAYGVGRTLENFCKKFKSVHAKNIQKMVKRLQLDLSKRMTLEEAETYLALMENGKISSKLIGDQQNIENGPCITITQD
jgi:Protein kinase domain